MGQSQACLSAEPGRHSHGQGIGHLPAELDKKQAQPKSAVETTSERLDWRAIRKTLWTENVRADREQSTERTLPARNANPVGHMMHHHHHQPKNHTFKR